MKTTLLVLAAGLGSRFGGDKQISHVGPQGEILMEYSIHDAIEAGFNKVVFVLKDEMVDTVKNTVGEKFKDRVELEYATQDYSSLPDFYVLPPERVKPFGTVHAVLCAKEYLTEPFATVNADDYYGKECFVLMHDFLTRLKGASDAAMVTYILKNTVSDNGAVTRGICSVKDGKLVKVDETGGIVPKDGVIVGENGEIDPESEVSMNFWGFHQDVLGRMQRYFEDFLKGLKPDEIKAECLLPVMVDQQMRKGALEVSVLHSTDKWFGMTYHEDREIVAEELRKLHDSGAYPESLRV